MSASSQTSHFDGATKAFLQLAAAADIFERYENPHSLRIARIADELGRTFHMAPQDRRSLRSAALLHDLGEVVMEREYIQRSGPLSEEERLDLARHPIIGEQESARAGADRAVQLFVRWHHEWWNGSGYPDALRRREIPLAARILRVADSYAAMTDTRPYRDALSEAEARQRIVDGAATEFDPKVVLAFLSLPSIEELSSFVRSAEQSTKRDRDYDLFSSFTK